MDKETAILMLQSDFARIRQEKKDFSKQVENLEQEGKNYIKELLSQIKKGSGSIIGKTPKVSKKKQNRIQAIPENEEVETESLSASTRNDTVSLLEVSDVHPVGRAKRGASIKAADNIKKQQSLTLTTKLRRPSEKGDETLLSKIVKETRSKRPKQSFGSSDEEDIRPSKQIKTDKKKIQSKSKKINADSEPDATFVKENSTVGRESRQLKRKLEEQDADQDSTLISEKSVQESPKSGPVAKKAHYSNTSPKKQDKTSKYTNTLDKISESPGSAKQNEQAARRTTRSSSSVIKAHGGQKGKTNIINETVDTSNADETLASMYEDAVGKPLPIMNSTMNPSSTVTLDKMMNVTVLIEPMSAKKAMDETVTIKKSMFKEPTSAVKMNETRVISKETNQDVRRSSRTQKAMEQKKKIDRFNDLITDDESSPERKGRQETPKRRTTRSNNTVLMSDEDEVQRTPIQSVKQNKDFKLPSAIKSAYKPAALFSPYAKDSVKKRVEAFEQVAVSPNKVEGEVVSGRVTRTKTRALAAASEIPAQTVTQKLARKSLAKAKKISLAKHNKEYDDVKENENTNIIKSKKTSSLEMSAQKPQPKTTPLGKTRYLQMPSSAQKNQFATPSNAQTLNAYAKPLTASRGNIVTHVDSFIQPMKSASKPSASEERRRRMHDEDARRKREELLKAQAEEKRRRREEKELKNKLAREAKEKLEYEKRLKAEREREEKARLAQQMQEKQKEEMERKRIVQMQRAQEKEERRRQEELLRMQRLQEQEEQERLLAEQKRREQEQEKRKQAELRHQMAEIKAKNQIEKAALQSKQAKALAAQKLAPNNYKIDSDPDEEDTDDECKPKHQIPQWALKNVRQAQLAMQQYVPIRSVLKFFDAKKCTPDLRDLFKGIDPKKLKRTSSAIWKTPPRFSMMDRSMIRD